MSLSFSPSIRQQPAHGSALVVLGMLMVAVFIIALAAATGMGSPDATALIGGP